MKKQRSRGGMGSELKKKNVVCIAAADIEKRHALHSMQNGRLPIWRVSDGWRAVHVAGGHMERRTFQTQHEAVAWLESRPNG